MAAAEPVRRSFLWARIVVAAALLLAAVRTFSSHDVAAIVTVAATIVVLAVGAVEGRLRSVAGAFTASAVLVGVDTAVTVLLVMVHDIQLGDPTAIVLVLPLFEAAARHGLVGAIAAWLAASMAMVVRLAFEWDGSRLDLSGPVAFLALLLLVVLPAAHLSEHLVDLIDRFHLAHRAANERANLLTQILDANAGFVAASSSHEIDDVLLSNLSLLARGRWRIVESDESAGEAGTITPVSADGVGVVSPDATRIVVSLGGDPPRIVQGDVVQGDVVQGGVDDHVDPVTLEAVEMLCAQARLSQHTLWLHTRARLDAEFWAGRARTDELTGLLNRAGFSEAVTPLLVPTLTERVAVIYLDLDGFKLVNDLLGHDVGDGVLRDVAAKISAAHPDGIAARLGGDEFAVVIRLGTHQRLDQVCAQLSDRIDCTLRIDDDNFMSVAASIGATIIEPGDGTGIDEALRTADDAMYEHKRQRKARTLVEVQAAAGPR